MVESSVKKIESWPWVKIPCQTTVLKDKNEYSYSTLSQQAKITQTTEKITAEQTWSTEEDLELWLNALEKAVKCSKPLFQDQKWTFMLNITQNLDAN